MGAWDKLEQAADKIKDKVSGDAEGETKSAGGAFEKVKDVIDDATDKVKGDDSAADETAEKKAAEQKAAEETAAAAKKAQQQKKEAAEKKEQAAKQREYVVKPGDNLSTIALKHGHGISYMELAKFNGIKNPDLIHPGQVIKFPH